MAPNRCAKPPCRMICWPLAGRPTCHFPACPGRSSLPPPLLLPLTSPPTCTSCSCTAAPPPARAPRPAPSSPSASADDDRLKQQSSSEEQRGHIRCDKRTVPREYVWARASASSLPHSSSSPFPVRSTHTGRRWPRLGWRAERSLRKRGHGGGYKAAHARGLVSRTSSSTAARFRVRARPSRSVGCTERDPPSPPSAPLRRRLTQRHARKTTHNTNKNRHRKEPSRNRARLVASAIKVPSSSALSPGPTAPPKRFRMRWTATRTCYSGGGPRGREEDIRLVGVDVWVGTASGTQRYTSRWRACATAPVSSRAKSSPHWGSSSSSWGANRGAARVGGRGAVCVRAWRRREALPRSSKSSGGWGGFSQAFRGFLPRLDNRGCERRQHRPGLAACGGLGEWKTHTAEPPGLLRVAWRPAHASDTTCNTQRSNAPAPCPSAWISTKYPALHGRPWARITVIDSCASC